MAFSSPSKPLSSTSLGGHNFASRDAAEKACILGWRSEAFAEDLFGDEEPAARRARFQPVWRGVLLCAGPLALAFAGGLMAVMPLSF